jgi:hypothetical protein
MLSLPFAPAVSFQGTLYLDLTQFNDKESARTYKAFGGTKRVYVVRSVPSRGDVYFMGPKASVALLASEMHRPFAPATL